MGIEEKKKPEQVSWNLGESLIYEIAGLLKGSSSAYVRREFSVAFDNLKSVRMRVSADLDDDELNEFTKLEDKMYILLRQTKNIGFNRTPEQGEAAFKFWKALDKYNLKLMRALKKYGYSIPLKEDKTHIRA